MSIDLLKPGTPTGDVILKWLQTGKYRVVKYDLPPDDCAWYLVKVGWFGSVSGVPGSDMGCPGEYNYQLATACNPVAVIYKLIDVARQHIRPMRVRNRGKDDLPRTKIIDEIDVKATVANIVDKATQDSNIHDLNKLVKRHEVCHCA